MLYLFIYEYFFLVLQLVAWPTFTLRHVCVYIHTRAHINTNTYLSSVKWLTKLNSDLYSCSCCYWKNSGSSSEYICSNCDVISRLSSFIYFFPGAVSGDKTRPIDFVSFLYSIFAWFYFNCVSCLLLLLVDTNVSPSFICYVCVCIISFLFLFL